VDLRFEERGTTLLARADGEELGADSAERVRIALLQEISSHPWVIMDLSPVTFMDSSGLGVLVAAMKAVRGRGDLRLIGVHPRVQELFGLTGLGRVFQVDVDEAAASAALELARQRVA
jgi:anti-sigma B factor antagonist